MYCCYTTETGYALFANLGSLSCPQLPSHHYKGDERRATKKKSVRASIYFRPNTGGPIPLAACGNGASDVGCREFALLVQEPSGKVFIVTMEMTCRGLSLQDEQESGRSQRLACRFLLRQIKGQDPLCAIWTDHAKLGIQHKIFSENAFFIYFYLIKLQIQPSNLACRMGHSLNPLDLLNLSIWERAHRKCLEIRGKTWKVIG